jgi:hypothetical protein
MVYGHWCMRGDVVPDALDGVGIDGKPPQIERGDFVLLHGDCVESSPATRRETTCIRVWPSMWEPARRSRRQGMKWEEAVMEQPLANARKSAAHVSRFLAVQSASVSHKTRRAFHTCCRFAQEYRLRRFVSLYHAGAGWPVRWASSSEMCRRGRQVYIFGVWA